jgi:acetyl-CoA carboxylase biotin carboxylase subunit
MKKLLVANRGEIALRIFKAARELGIKTVAVYSDADHGAPHMRAADEAIHIGKSPPPLSYLNIAGIMKAVAESGADAVHPGYGFLSENAAFAGAVEDSGTIWVGPSPGVIRDIESKSFCRNLGNRLGVPVTPGSIGNVTSLIEIEKLFAEHGPPLLLKLDKGGGGKGIQPILHAEEIARIFESSMGIGKAAFGSSDVYVEKRIENPKHIEIQCLGDHYGNYVALGERECSVQRRFQKVVEEAPSPAVTQEDRERLCAWSVRILKEMGYRNAGTVEFIRSAEGRYYFMEVNARIQVEHPVTEMVTGIDLVQQQLRIAMGEPLQLRQEDIVINGHAIEARIYAEDPSTFLPSPGRIGAITFPALSKETRLDHALESGLAVSPFYDPMLAKLIAWGPDRRQAIARLDQALRQFTIEGIKTTISLATAVMDSEAFQQGIFHTEMLAGLLQTNPLPR